MCKLVDDNSGMALILTILIVSLVVSLTLQLNATMRTDMSGAANVRDGIRLNYVAKSGFNYALAVLQADARADSKEGDRGDSLLEAWADQETFLEGAAALFSNSRFQVKISDHSGRIQINNLINDKGEKNNSQIKLLTRFLASPEFELDEDHVNNIVAAVIDWIDNDDEITTLDSGGIGAETKDYLRMDPPYPCHDGPIGFLEELLLVKGVTKELFYGIEEKPGISDYLSVHGDGKININTADGLVLRALSEEMTDSMVENMLEYRQDRSADLSAVDWEARVDAPGVPVPDESIIGTKSSFFEVAAFGFEQDMTKKMTGMVERTEETMRILSLKIE